MVQATTDRIAKSKRIWLLFALCAGTLLTIRGCWFITVETTTYPPLGVITRAVIRDDRQVLRVIDDPIRVRALARFIDEHRHGWGGNRYWAGIPVPRLVVDLYNESRFCGHFGVGSGFFECQREGDFNAKPTTPAREQAFLELIGPRRSRVAE